MTQDGPRFKGPSLLRPFAGPGSKAVRAHLLRIERDAQVGEAKLARILLGWGKVDAPPHNQLINKAGWIRHCHLAFSLDHRFYTRDQAKGFWEAVKDHGLIYADFLCGTLDDGTPLSHSQCMKILGLALISIEPQSKVPQGVVERLDLGMKTAAGNFWGRHFGAEIARIEDVAEQAEIESRIQRLRVEERAARRESARNRGDAESNATPSRIKAIQSEIQNCRAKLSTADAGIQVLKTSRLAAGNAFQSDAAAETIFTIRWETVPCP